MFALLDYAIFSTMLIISMLIGVYFGFFGTKQSTQNEYLLGMKKMNIVPIGVSVTVSHLSSIVILGVPADVYRYGAYFWLSCFSDFIAYGVGVFIFLPVFFEMQYTSCYDYLEQRFDTKTKVLGVYLGMMQEVLSFPITIYSASLVFSTATGISVQLTAFVACAICIFYTTIGGLKTVVWTDFFQFGTIVGTLVVVSVLGVQKLGGLTSVWNTAIIGDHLDVFNFDFDPTAPNSFWGIFCSGAIFKCAMLFLTQGGAQKFLALPKFGSTIWAALYSMFCHQFVITFCVLIGLSIYARYSTCDPFLAGEIKKHDELLLFFTMDVAGHISGMLGLFMAGIFSAAFSYMSSILNAVSGLIYDNFISKCLKTIPPENTITMILKLNVFILGCVCTCNVYLVQHLGMILGLAYSLGGVVLGPLFAMFCLGMLIPNANSTGCFSGVICGIITVSSILIPAKYYNFQGFPTVKPKPVTTEGCLNWNQTNTSIINDTLPFQAPYIFRITPFYYSIIGCFVTLAVGLVISSITNKSDTKVDEKLITPMCRRLLFRKKRNNQSVLYTSVRRDDRINYQ